MGNLNLNSNKQVICFVMYSLRHLSPCLITTPNLTYLKLLKMIVSSLFGNVRRSIRKTLLKTCYLQSFVKRFNSGEEIDIGVDQKDER